MLRYCNLDHEIQETREATRYKVGDGGTLLPAVKVTHSPHRDRRQEGEDCFESGSSKVSSVVDWSRFPDSGSSRR